MSGDDKQHQEATVTSRWAGEELIWTINGRDVTDEALRKWCFHNMGDSYSRYVDVVRKCHTEAWAKANAPVAVSHEAPPASESISDDLKWLRWQADMSMAGDDKFANRLLGIAELIEALQRQLGEWAARSSIGAPAPVPVSRYVIKHNGEPIPSKDGEWVDYGDYEALEKLYIEQTGCSK